MRLTLLMPCLNEAGTLAACIRAAQAGLASSGLDGEILVADNGSTDGSQALAEKLGARVVHIPVKGYGSALLGGIAAARGEWVLMGDADESYDFSSIGGFLQKLTEGYDLVMGCRMPSGGGRILPGAMPWKHRWLGNPVLTGIGRLLFHCPSHDFHCGMRAFRRDAVLELDLKTTGMEFASEMVIKARLAGLRFAEVPITLHKDGRNRPPHLRSWRDGWRHLRFMLLFSPRWLFFYPGALIALLGLLGVSILLPGPFRLGTATLDTNSMMVFAMLLQLGVQVLLFAAFTRLYAHHTGLLPPTRTVDWFDRHFSMETGLLAGLLLHAAGAVLLGQLVLAWGRSGFGALDYSGSMRIVILSVSCFMLGTQVVFGSFFLGFLGLKTSNRT